MCRINLFFFVIIQFVLLFDGSKQSHVKQTTITVKTIGNAIKNPVGMFCQNKSTIKNIACGLQKKYLRTRNTFGSKSVKYLREEGIKICKYMTPQTATRSKQLIGSGSKKNIYMRSVAQMGKKKLRYLAKRSAEQIRGKELSSLINVLSESKPQLPFLFVTGGLNRLTQSNLVPKDTSFKEFYKEKKETHQNKKQSKKNPENTESNNKKSKKKDSKDIEKVDQTKEQGRKKASTASLRKYVIYLSICAAIGYCSGDLRKWEIRNRQSEQVKKLEYNLAVANQKSKLEQDEYIN